MPFGDQFKYESALQAQKDWYNGIEFRSKLESKTAQALDNIGMAYEYEPEGYKLSNGMWYRPDFWLPDAHQFIECKGVMDSTDSAKICGLVEDTRRSVMVISYDNAMLFTFWEYEEPHICTYGECLMLGQCNNCGEVIFYSDYGSYQCSACGYYDGDHSLVPLAYIESGQQLFNYGQQLAADKPIYKEIANNFNN